VYSRKRLRLRGFDYASENLYLVTACAHARRCIFGAIVGEVFIASSFGDIARRQVQLIPARLLGVSIDTVVVMPNHVHVIVRLERARQASPLRVVVGSFKSGSTREINNLRSTPGATVWQRGYHDHVIRDEADLRRVREYVDTNPIRWALDPENPNRRP
jgi:putative transposase